MKKEANSQAQLPDHMLVETFPVRIVEEFPRIQGKLHLDRVEAKEAFIIVFMQERKILAHGLSLLGKPDFERCAAARSESAATTDSMAPWLNAAAIPPLNSVVPALIIAS
jgi:hypothetical protein